MTILAAFVLVLAVQSAGQDVAVTELEAKMLELVNVEREARGLRPFEHVPVLSDVARKHSQAMRDLNTFSHEAGGSMAEDRIKGVIEDACHIGENITRHYLIDYAMSDLMGSPGHRGNLLDPGYTGIGIGIVRGKGGLLYITQDFVGPCKKLKKTK
jgi:uncharacterized protein YkwD